jgi:hypothetical protein
VKPSRQVRIRQLVKERQDTVNADCRPNKAGGSPWVQLFRLL